MNEQPVSIRTLKLGLVGLAVVALERMLAADDAVVAVAVFVTTLVGPALVLFPARWRGDIGEKTWRVFAASYAAVFGLVLILPPIWGLSGHLGPYAVSAIASSGLRGASAWASRSGGLPLRPASWAYQVAAVYAIAAGIWWLGEPSSLVTAFTLHGLAGLGAASTTEIWLKRGDNTR